MTNKRNTSGSPVALTEKILEQCHNLYSEKENGLCDIAKSMGTELLEPRKKITVMLIGNHSAGKSSFINWYIEEHIQKTGVAIETQGFTIVTTGKKRETLTGNATIHLYPHFKPLVKINKMANYLHTEVTTSKTKQAPLLHLVDTPGLVDGDMKYPFDVNEAILFMSELVDLVLVFFDPIGQALCKRTLDVVEQISLKSSNKLRFFLSKADEAGDESDRQRVLMQIVQELCRRPSLNQTCFDMPTIYLDMGNTQKRCLNQIQSVCDEISKTIDMTLQTTLNSLEVDCETISRTVETKIDEDDKNRIHNQNTYFQYIICLSFILMMPMSWVANTIGNMVCVEKSTDSLCKVIDQIRALPDPFLAIVRHFPVDSHFYAKFVVITVWIMAVVMAKYSFGTRPTLGRREKKSLQAKALYVTEKVLPMKEKLYQDYLNDTVGEE